MPETGRDITYPLCFHTAERRLVFKFKYEGMTLHPDRLEWTAEGHVEKPYASIDSISLTIGEIPRSGTIANCKITFRDLSVLNVTSTNPTGTSDDARSEAYAAFLRDFHGRLSEADRKRIHFHAGSSQARENFGRVVLVIAAIFFIVLPLGLFFITRDWQTIGLMFAGGALVWPLWNVLRKNRPREYDPAHLDEDVFP